METTKDDDSLLNNKEQANALCNKTFLSGQQHVMDSEVIDAEKSEDTEDVEDLIAKLNDFDFDNVLDKKSDYAFVQEAMCAEMKMMLFWIYEARTKYIIRNIMMARTPRIFFLMINLPFI